MRTTLIAGPFGAELLYERRDIPLRDRLAQQRLPHVDPAAVTAVTTLLLGATPAFALILQVRVSLA